MTETGPERGLDRIADLVRDEEEAALAWFRSRDFPARVAGAWRERGRDAGRRPALRWAVAAAVLIVAGAALLLVRRPGPPGRGPGFEALAGMLDGLPGGRALAAGDAVRPAPTPGAGPAGAVLSALAGAMERPGGDEAPAVAIGGAAPSGPRLSLRRKMKILFGDRVIERVFLLLKDSSKEV